jgi:hypothetical protein
MEGSDEALLASILALSYHPIYPSSTLGGGNCRPGRQLAIERELTFRTEALTCMRMH